MVTLFKRASFVGKYNITLEFKDNRPTRTWKRVVINNEQFDNRIIEFVTEEGEKFTFPYSEISRRTIDSKNCN